MTNKEINIEICKIMGYSYEVEGDAVLANLRKSKGNLVVLQSIFDPCRIPGDADPVIEKFKVSIVWDDHFNLWTSFCGSIEVSGANRLETAMGAVVEYSKLKD